MALGGRIVWLRFLCFFQFHVGFVCGFSSLSLWIHGCFGLVFIDFRSWCFPVFVFGFTKIELCKWFLMDRHASSSI